ARAREGLAEGLPVPALDHLRAGDPEPQKEAAARELVERGRGRRGHGRRARRHLHDRAAETDPARLPPDPGERRHRVRAVRLGRPRAARDEERLADAVPGAEAAGLGRAALEVVLLDRGPDRLRAVVQLGLARRRVPEAVAAAEAALVDARELGDDVVERGRLDAAGAEVDAPAVHAGGVLVAVARVRGGLRAHEVE